MCVAILINILIVLIVVFAQALVEALKLNKSGRNFIENIDESKKVTPLLLLLILVGKDLHIQKI